MHTVVAAGGRSTDTCQHAALAASVAADKKGQQTVVLDVGDIISITELFVITSGTNVRQVRTIAEGIEQSLKEAVSVSPRSVEGLADASWVLLDYGDFVVHVFLAETRAFYDLDRLWADAPRVDWEERIGKANAAAGGQT